MKSLLSGKLLALICFFTILILNGCRKDPVPEEGSFICSDCLTGNWELVKGVKIIGSDTFELYENGKQINFWYGARDGNSYDDHRVLKISKDSFQYVEELAGDSPWQYPVMPAEGWKWLSSTYSKSLLRMPLRFTSASTSETFRIKKLTSNELVLEGLRGWGIADYMYCEFKRAADSPVPAGNSEKLTSQLPAGIPGAWKLTEYSEQYNDSVFTKVINDTIINQSYFWHYSHYSPAYYTKEITRARYGLIMHLDQNGNFSMTATEENESRITVGYWYWTDDLVSHRKIYVEPMIASIITDYDLILLDSDNLVFRYGDNISYKFKRVQ